jgi:hypothetical protein
MVLKVRERCLLTSITERVLPIKEMVVFKTQVKHLELIIHVEQELIERR